MNELVIELADGQTAYQPGETLQGRVRWSLDQRPKQMEVVLFWHTEGKGSTDSHVVERVQWEDPGERGDKLFAFTLPDAPHSFSGKLISLIWGVEVILKKEKRSEHVDFVLSPGDAAIQLPDLGEDAEPKIPNLLKKFVAKHASTS